MSSMYYRVTREPPPPPRFGFKKVDQKQLQEILSRVTKPRLSTPDRPDTSRSTSRPKSSQNGRRKNYPTEQDWQRMIRRLQRPTFSHKMARTQSQKSRSQEQQHQQQKESVCFKLPRSKSTIPTASKGLEKLCRPTTATLAKSLFVCHLCGANPSSSSSTFDYDYTERKNLQPEEVEKITERVRMHTCSSHPESRPCTRGGGVESPDSMIQDIRLPLISGLDRSKTVSEITDRLQPARCRQNTPAATVISVS
ncbi:uncharacterized protein LOC135464934 [Liolophura sinensis]|uniref:uncharacterized protein LOC135464934 n=1 Tax=Liolophura sinensis TaxID=3198878 RepID=UPI0031587D5D